MWYHPCSYFRGLIIMAMSSGAPPGSISCATKSGWINEGLFIVYLNLVIQLTRCRKEHKILLILDSHESHITLKAVAYLCRSYPCPGSIAMIAFRDPSRFWASFGSSWCCFRSFRTRSIHLSLGLPRGLFPPTFIIVTCFATFVSSLHITWPYHKRRFWATHGVIGSTIASLLNFSFLIRSFLVLP